MLNTNQKIEHLRNLGFNGDFEQIERMYNGEKFDVRDEEYRRLLQLSKEYCMKNTLDNLGKDNLLQNKHLVQIYKKVGDCLLKNLMCKFSYCLPRTGGA